MTEIVGMCEWCGMPILGHEGQKRRDHHITKDVCIEIMVARIEKLEAEALKLREQLQASNESLKMYVQLPAPIID